MIKDRLDVQVSEEELAGLMRVGAIADLVESRAARV
jgi:acyl carrier protein